MIDAFHCVSFNILTITWMKPRLCSLQLPTVETATSLNPNTTQQSFGHPRPSNHLSSRRSLGLRLHSEPTFIHEATAVPEPPQQHNIRDAATNGPVHPCVLADRSVHLPEPAPSSGSTEQASVAQASPVQQPGSLEQMNPSFHRWSQMQTHVFYQEDQFQPGSSESSRPTALHNTTQQWVASVPAHSCHHQSIRCFLQLLQCHSLHLLTWNDESWLDKRSNCDKNFFSHNVSTVYRLKDLKVK